MKDFILGMIIGLVIGVWIGVNLGQGQDIFSNPFNFLSKNKQVASVQQMDNTTLNDVKKLDSRETSEQAIDDNSSSSITSEMNNKPAEEGVFKNFMDKFE